MDKLREKLVKINSENIIRVIISNKKDKNQKFEKIIISKVKDFYQGERFIDNQVFHDNLKNNELIEYVEKMYEENFKQINLFTEDAEYSIRATKKGDNLFSKNKLNTSVKEKSSHNRKKEYILDIKKTIPPLVDMGVLSKDGKIIPTMRNKFIQINRFIEIIDDVVEKSDQTSFTVVDFGCGKSYLTFLMYYYFVEIKKLDIKMIGLDLKESVINHCSDVAKKYGYKNLSFSLGDIKDFVPDYKIDIVISLHACDVATDYALFNAINWDVNMIFSVPCCHKEVAKQISSEKFNILNKYGIVKGRFASGLTDAIRANLLTYMGYKTQLLEFVDFENTPKNTLIRAEKANISGKIKKESIEEFYNVKNEFNINPMLYKLLNEDKKISDVEVMHG